MVNRNRRKICNSIRLFSAALTHDSFFFLKGTNKREIAGSI